MARGVRRVMIGIQSGPREAGSQWLPCRTWWPVGDADCGDDCRGSSGLFDSQEADQGIMPRVSQSRAQGDSVRSDRVSRRASPAAIAAD